MNKKVNLLKLYLIKITAIETGEVLDVTSCPTTARVVRRGNGDKLKNPEDVCELNYESNNGGMEIEGARAILYRSLLNPGVRYLTYLGKGTRKEMLLFATPSHMVSL